MPPVLAHLDGDRGHALSDHHEAVGQKAADNARHIPLGAWLAGNSGRIHDVGKGNPDWQAYLRGEATRVPHARIGALQAVMALGKDGLPGQAGIPLAYIIDGHHAGLPDWIPEVGEREGLKDLLPPLVRSGAIPTPDQAERLLEVRRTLQCCLEHNEGVAPIPMPDTVLPQDPRFSTAFWIRMAFSAMVDADFTDTEAFYRSGVADVRSRKASSLSDLKARLDSYMVRKASSRGGNADLHAMRQEVLGASRKAADEGSKGLFRLDVPTGLGKTLSGMTFALDHAIAHGLERVIYVAPFLGIIEQTAAEMRAIFGDEAVVEHHTSSEPGQGGFKAKLAAENWDAPIVITTAVQFFESLFSNRPSRCRKLHNMTGAVVLLDEAQAVPPGCIAPVTHAIEQLVRFYSSSIVLMTATQPGLQKTFGGLPDAYEIVPDSARLHTAMQRVRVERPASWSERVSWIEVADWMREAPSALTIIDSRPDARTLFRELGLSRAQGGYHLSTYQCPRHRRELLAEIRQRLKAGQGTRVVSTRLIEAGVNVDFPCVFRAIAGLDSIIQAGGRCNREGLLPDKGLLRVFVPQGWGASGTMAMMAEAAKCALNQHVDDPLSPAAIETYFTRLHWALGSALDDKGVLERLHVDPVTLARPGKDGSGRSGSLQYNFDRASSLFRMIDDKERGVVTRYGDGARIIHSLQTTDAPNRSLLREAAQNSASLPGSKVQSLLDRGVIAWTPSELLVQVDPRAYDVEIGWIAE